MTAKEVALAKRLIDDMTEHWKPGEFKDTYHDDLMARIRQKVKTRETNEVTEPAEGEAPRRSAEVIDLMAALEEPRRQGREAAAAPSGVTGASRAVAAVACDGPAPPARLTVRPRMRRAGPSSPPGPDGDR